MKKPDRKRIPLDRPRKPAAGNGDERAYTSNYGDEKRPPRPRDGEGEKPFRKRNEASAFSGERKPFSRKPEGERGGFKKPYGTRSTEGGDGGFKKPYSGRSGDGERPFKKPYNSEGGDRPFKKPFAKREDGDNADRKPYRDNADRPAKKPFANREGNERKPFNKEDNRGDRKPFGERKPFVREGDGEQRPFRKDGDPKAFGERKFSRSDEGEKRPFRNEDDRPARKPFNRDADSDRKPFGERKSFGLREDKPAFRKEGGDRKPYGEKRSFGPRDESSGFRKDGGERKPYNRSGDGEKRPYRERSENSEDRNYDKPRRRKESYEDAPEPKAASTNPVGMTLNKYLAHAGVCGRREAGELVKSGKVQVNKETMTTPGYRIAQGDVVSYEGRVVKPEPAKVYVLLNKPKGFITTTEDEADRRTVMELVQGVEAERLYPVGRLDRNTTGVLLLTNDGDLAQRLTHPKYQCKKIYQVTLDKDLTKADFEQIVEGVTLEDGEIKVDALAYLEDKKEIGIEIHSGRNRIVRRIFEHLGYSVEKLDRVMFAGLTKKNVPRGKYRLLTDKEVILLKHFKS